MMGGCCVLCRANNWFRDICPAWRVAKADWTVLIAEVVGDVDASLSFGELLAFGGLDGISESQEQFGEGGCASYLCTCLSVAKFRASLSDVVSAWQSELSSLNG